MLGSKKKIFTFMAKTENQTPPAPPTSMLCIHRCLTGIGSLRENNIDTARH